MIYFIICATIYFAFELHRKQKHINRLQQYMIIRNDILLRCMFRKSLITPKEFDFIKKEMFEHDMSVVDYANLKKELAKIGIDVDKPASY